MAIGTRTGGFRSRVRTGTRRFRCGAVTLFGTFLGGLLFVALLGTVTAAAGTRWFQKISPGQGTIVNRTCSSRPSEAGSSSGTARITRDEVAWIAVAR